MHDATTTETSEVHFPRRPLDREREDETSYLIEHPLIEPYIDGAVLLDNGQDLEATIGKRTVRFRSLDETTKDLDGKACHVCGLWFRTPSHVDRLSAMDRITEPFGGRTALGPLRAHWGTLRDPVVSLSVKLPDALSAMLCADGVKRQVWVTWRDALDGTHKGEFYTTVYNLASRASVLLRGTGVALTHKHTQGIRLVPAKIAKFADQLPGRIAEHAAGLQAMASRILTREEIGRFALLIANDGDDPADAEAGEGEPEIKASVRRVADTIENMILAADGVNVPRCSSPGVYTALQLFESACSYDRHHRTVRKTGITDRDSVVRMSRVLDGNTYGDTAWDLLTAPV